MSGYTYSRDGPYEDGIETFFITDKSESFLLTFELHDGESRYLCNEPLYSNYQHFLEEREGKRLDLYLPITDEDRIHKKMTYFSYELQGQEGEVLYLYGQANSFLPLEFKTGKGRKTLIKILDGITAI